MTRVSRPKAALLLWTLAALATAAEPKRLTLLVTGDNRGEVAPCG